MLMVYLLLKLYIAQDISDVKLLRAIFFDILSCLYIFPQ